MTLAYCKKLIIWPLFVGVIEIFTFFKCWSLEKYVLNKVSRIVYCYKHSLIYCNLILEIYYKFKINKKYKFKNGTNIKQRKIKR